MHAKPYPEAKRRILIERDVGDFVTFLNEVTESQGNTFIRNQLLQRSVNGFKPGHVPFNITVPILISKLRREQELTNPDSPIWDMFNNAWRCWVSSHQELNDILLEFDNNADFDENQQSIVPPNSELDRQCFVVLLEASRNNQINQETIRRFYEYGHFNEDEQIEELIDRALPREEIERMQQIEQIPEQVDTLRQEIEELRTQISNLEPISELQQVLDERIAEVQQTFENQFSQLNVSQNVRQLKQSIDSLKSRLHEVENSLKSRIDEVDTPLKTQIEALENSQTKTDSAINDFVNFTEKTTAQLERKIQNKNQSVEKRLGRMDSAIAEIKSMVEEQNQTNVQRIARQAIEIGRRYGTKLASETGGYSNEEEYLEKMSIFQQKFGLTNLEERDDSEEIAAAVHIAMKAFPALEITDDRLIKIWQLICGDHLHITKINVELGWLGSQDWFPYLFSEECFDERLERNDLDVSIRQMLKSGDMPWAIHLNNCDKSYPDSYLPSFLDWIKKICGDGIRVFLTRCSGTNRCETSEDFYERVARLPKPNEQAPINVRHLEDLHVVTRSKWVSWCHPDTSAGVSFEKQLTLLKKLQTIIENMEVQLPEKIIPEITHYLQLSHNILTSTGALDWALTLRLLPWIEKQTEIVDSIYSRDNWEEWELPHFYKGLQKAREKNNESN